METKLLTLPNGKAGSVVKKLKENISLIRTQHDLYIIKGQRNKRGFLENLRFLNEKRIYECLGQPENRSINVPKYWCGKDDNFIQLEFIKRKDTKVRKKDYVQKYFRLQRVEPKSHITFDLINQFLRGYFYRVFCVSLFSLWKKTSPGLSLKAILLYIRLESSQRGYGRKYWMHGDLTGRNYFYNEQEDLYFIDFENMFYTRKWFLSEIIGKSFKFDASENSLEFKKGAVKEYLKKIPEDKTLSKYDLKKQISFGILQHAVLQIVQTKSNEKRKAYINLLNTVYEKNDFEEWYSNNIDIQL